MTILYNLLSINKKTTWRFFCLLIWWKVLVDRCITKVLNVFLVHSKYIDFSDAIWLGGVYSWISDSTSFHRSFETSFNLSIIIMYSYYWYELLVLWSPHCPRIDVLHCSRTLKIALLYTPPHCLLLIFYRFFLKLFRGVVSI